MFITECECKKHCNGTILRIITAKDDRELFNTTYLKEEEVELTISDENKSLSIIINKEELRRLLL